MHPEHEHLTQSHISEGQPSHEFLADLATQSGDHRNAAKHHAIAAQEHAAAAQSHALAAQSHSSAAHSASREAEKHHTTVR